MESFGKLKKDWSKNIRYLEQAANRLNGVVVENKDFTELIKGYDRMESFFYLDPPYYEAEKYYDVEFGETEHWALRDILGKINEKFLLSYNDSDFIRQLYDGYEIISLDRQHNLLTKKGSKKCKEILQYE